MPFETTKHIPKNIRFFQKTLNSQKNYKHLNCGKKLCIMLGNRQNLEFYSGTPSFVNPCRLLCRFGLQNLIDQSLWRNSFVRLRFLSFAGNQSVFLCSKSIYKGSLF